MKMKLKLSRSVMLSLVIGIFYGAEQKCFAWGTSHKLGNGPRQELKQETAEIRNETQKIKRDQAKIMRDRQVYGDSSEQVKLDEDKLKFDQTEKSGLQSQRATERTQVFHGPKAQRRRVSSRVSHRRQPRAQISFRIGPNSWGVGGGMSSLRR